MAYVELGQDNGGILLNLGEGGFAVQSALALTSREFPELRFQVPAAQGWLAAGGRIVWISDSNKEAGIQFTELPGEARRAIQRWVSAEGEPQKTVERTPVTSSESSPNQILEAPYRGGGGVRQTIRDGAHTNGVRAERERGPAIPKQAGSIAVAEPPPQDFHFTDYSMFAAAPEKVGVWAEPPRHQGSWRRGALGILVAVLFFALGATVGRETIERWIADVAGWTQNEPTPNSKVTPPAPAAAGPGAAESNSEAKSTTGEDHATTEDSVKPSSGSAADSAAGGMTNEEKKSVDVPQSKPETAKTGPVPESGTSGAKLRSEAAVGGPKRFTESAASRDRREMEVVPSSIAAEHSILVNAPEPGSPPFIVNLPGEAISASGAIAISARRTLEILPRGAGSNRSERVVIGKLISHSEPFYPMEARNHHIEGNVELQARVGRSGEIISVTPLSGQRLLSSAAMTAVREWRYEPTFVDGDPAETLADITVVFRLR